jgi:mono/diheme cytochrome c family protein
MRVILGILLVLVLAAVGVAAWLFSGSYDLSARATPGKVSAWLADTAKRQSVRAHAQHIDPPPLADAILVEDGARHYREACVQCHGAPGVEPQAFARAMQPVPPDLAKAPGGWTPAQLFWIIQNGLRLSGMPAYQAAMVDGEIWSLVAFLDQLPKLDASRYQAMTTPPAPPQSEPAPAEQDVVPPAEGEEPAPAPTETPPTETAPRP